MAMALHSPSPFRFVRLNPRFNEQETLAFLKAEVNCAPYPIPVPWLEGYYALPGDFALNQSTLFQSARVYGQDVSSGAAVAALLTERYDCNRHNLPEASSTTKRVLDLCCCPGLKLCAIADFLQGRQAEVVGVDVSEQRMAVCKRIVLKYQVVQSSAMEESDTNDEVDSSVRIRMYCNDATTLATLDSTTLNLVFDSVVAKEDDAMRLGKRKRMNKSGKSRESKLLRECIALDTEIVTSTHETAMANVTSDVIPTEVERLRPFDRVLVDAECSTDGSIVHVQKRLVKDQQQRDQTVTNDKRMPLDLDATPKGGTPWTGDDRRAELLVLQRNLAAAGFRLLKKGGTMVYSTCSLEDDQNGGIVRWLLREFPNASIVPVDFLVNCDLKKEGSLPGTIQFLPNDDPSSEVIDPDRLCGGGFFLAKILKS